MGRRFYLLMLILVLPMTASGQEYIFKVLAHKGETLYRNSGQKKWQNVEYGAGLKKNDQVKVGKNSYLGLIHSSGMIMELIEPSESYVHELEGNSRLMKRGLPSKYTDFVYNTVASSEAEPIITRGFEKIHVYLPDVGLIYGEKALVRWKEHLDRNEYTITISDILGDEIMQRTVSGTQAEIDLTMPELNEKDLILKISSGEYTSGEYVISRLPADRKKEIEAELNSFIRQIDIGSTTGNALLGAFYEENQLLVEAFLYYYLACDQDLDNPLIMNFLIRHGMTR